MKYSQHWIAYLKDHREQPFAASVPGNVQADYADAYGYADINWNKNCEQYLWMEDCTWVYETELQFQSNAGEQVWFVSHGIDYNFRIFLNEHLLTEQEGMFHPVELELAKMLGAKNVLKIEILPHPKRVGAPAGTRNEADQSVKPPVSYGWDWHPRVIPSGLWEDAYIETRSNGHIKECEVSYRLSDDFNSAEVQFQIDLQNISGNVVNKVFIEFFAPDGTMIYAGGKTCFTVDKPELWWCNGQGRPNLYSWKVKTSSDEKSGTVGFRTVELVMNEGAWSEPRHFPKSRSNPPMTLRLNGRDIFAKGSNWVNPEIFTGRIGRGTYEPLLQLVRDANMNLLRCWGGAGINKQSFYELCDEYGIMVWQEFPLACNNYTGTSKYLSVLEQEAIAFVKALLGHASLVLWCGGNELFNSWSKMTDQSKALRLLNKICYELDPERPFIATSPLMGAGHGGYVFYDENTKQDVFGMFSSSRCTAYTEFGVPGVSRHDVLREIIPEDELFPPEPGSAWETHHAFSAFGKERWLCMDVLEQYWGRQNSLDELMEHSHWLQCEGYKAIFEEARRQKPFCSMALNWSFNEPWKTAANNSIVNYPAREKPAYYAVKDALRPVLASARIEKFCYNPGELFCAELWLLNDSPEAVEDSIRAYLSLGDSERFIVEWQTGLAAPNKNKRGHRLQFEIPAEYEGELKLVLKSVHGYDSTYRLWVKAQKSSPVRVMNLL